MEPSSITASQRPATRWEGFSCSIFMFHTGLAEFRRRGGVKIQLEGLRPSKEKSVRSVLEVVGGHVHRPAGGPGGRLPLLGQELEGVLADLLLQVLRQVWVVP